MGVAGVTDATGNFSLGGQAIDSSLLTKVQVVAQREGAAAAVKTGASANPASVQVGNNVTLGAASNWVGARIRSGFAVVLVGRGDVVTPLEGRRAKRDAAPFQLCPPRVEGLRRKGSAL